MANLRAIKTKIWSVKNLKKITRALEVVSTVKLQKIKGQADGLKQYFVQLMSVLSAVDEASSIFASEDNTQNKSEKTLVIAITSERGLCGGLNSKLMRKLYEDRKATRATDEYFVVGKKGLEFIKRMNWTVVGSLQLWDKFNDGELLPLYTFFEDAVAQGTYKNIVLYFNYFRNSIVQVPTSLDVYPVTKEGFESFALWVDITLPEQDPTASYKSIIIEPSRKKFVAEARRQLRKYIIASAIVQNKAGEHAARMIAMKNAKDNATSMVSSLTLTFNKARQWAITQEISEIVSAKLAIEG